MNSNEKNRYLRKLLPLLSTQFLGVFNDHAFKTVIVLTAVAHIQNNYSANAALLAIMTFVYGIPFLLFSELAGFCADRFSKRNVMLLAKLSEIIIMLAGTITLAYSASWGIIPLIGVMFMMAAQSAFFSPSFNGILPETFPEQEISRANGAAGMGTFIAVICGVGISFLLMSIVNQAYYCGLIFTVLAFAGTVTAMMIKPGLPANVNRRWDRNFFARYVKGFRYIFRHRALMLAILGEAFFVSFGTAIQAVLVIFAIYSLKIPATGHEIDIGLLQVIPAIGMGIGCYMAGRLSRGKVELGLVPIGAACLVTFLAATALIPGSTWLFGKHVVDGVTQAHYIVYPLTLLWLGLLGMGGGIFVIPLRAFQQQKTNPKNRGSVLANANVICFLSIMLTGVIMFFLTAGIAEGSGQPLNNFFGHLQQYCMTLSPDKLILGLAVLTFAATVYIFWLLPEFVLRFIVVMLTCTIYKLRIRGAENLPERGPVILIANHISFVDGLLITACSSRFVRFMMHEDYYRIPLLHKILKWSGMIEVPAEKGPAGINKMLDNVHSALRQGDVVCIFPEGRLTHNGLMSEFRRGVTKMIPEGMFVPIVPVRLGMIWGSIFSYYYGKIKPRMPKELPHPASVTFGKAVNRKATPFELRQMISELAAESEMEPQGHERTLHYRVAKNARFHPFRKNLYDFNGKAVGGFSFLVRSILLSREIRRLTAKDSKYVGVLLPNTTVSAVSVIAVMMADKVPAMLNYTASDDAMNAAVKQAEITMIITSRMFIKKAKLKERPEMIFLEDIAKQIPRKKRLIAALGAALLPHQELMNIVAPVTHRDLFATAVLLFSSGSTGTPKGVMLSHHNINSNAHSAMRIMGWRNDDAILGNLPLFHSFGMLTGLWIPLLSGSKVVYLPNPLDAQAVGETIFKNKLTILLATPTFMQTYMRKCTAEQFNSLRLAVVGAEKLRHDIAEKFSSMTDLVLVEGYGCTELSPVVSINIGNSILDIGKQRGRTGSVGAPLPGVCVKIVHPDSREPLPPGQPGLMLVKGPNVMQGYLKEPEKTAEVLQNGWYNTGDIAKMDLDGYITITGRLSRFSKIGGEMVPHELVEGAIYDILNSDKQCLAVCGGPDKSKGEKLVILHTELESSPDEIIGALRETDIPNLWIPKAANFHQVEHLPLLGSGKLDLKQLQQVALEFN